MALLDFHTAQGIEFMPTLPTPYPQDNLGSTTELLQSLIVTDKSPPLGKPWPTRWKPNDLPTLHQWAFKIAPRPHHDVLGRSLGMNMMTRFIQATWVGPLVIAIVPGVSFHCWKKISAFFKQKNETITLMLTGTLLLNEKT